MENSKAKDIVTISLKGKSDIADFMLVATGTSGRHVNSISENLLADLRMHGVKGVEPEGMETGDWVLIDLFDVIVHVMLDEARKKYDLEAMWQVPVEKKRAEVSGATAGNSPNAIKKASKKPARKPAAKGTKKPAAKKPATKKPVARKKPAK